MHYWDNGPRDGAWAVVMMLGMVAFWALLVVLIIWAVRSSRSSNVLAKRAQPSGAANRRAFGEIGSAEYQAKLEALRSRSAS
jgi:uncharacterized membrane protein